jgi:UDP-N-acetylmuramoylalanine--D-glutamate ligase
MHEYGSALILGEGRSGRAAERLLKAEGVQAQVVSQESCTDDEFQTRLSQNAFDVCVVSPGFSLDHPWVCGIQKVGIPLLSELELGWSRHKGRTIAVTGSNGKSTCVKWIHESLEAAGKTSAIGGNYGIPACEAVLEHPDAEWLVLEVSSFQLETVRDFAPDIAVLLNVLPNHLDRHGSMDEYRRMKSRIFGPAGARTRCLVPYDLIGELGSGNWITFGEDRAADYFFERCRVFCGGEAVLNLSDTPFASKTLGSCTGAAVAAVAGMAGIPPESVEKAARTFESLPHRLQRVGEIRGVTYINDSKATNLAATAAALEAVGFGIHLIAGGIPKESDYTFIKEVLAERVKRIYVTGQASRAMFSAWKDVVFCVECTSLEEAFSRAEQAADEGETILLSPGCASFDQFQSFEERGERFEALFHEAAKRCGDAD